MLKASASGTVLLRLIHTTRRSAPHLCFRRVRRISRSSPPSTIHVALTTHRPRVFQHVAPDVPTPILVLRHTPQHRCARRDGTTKDPSMKRGVAKEENLCEEREVSTSLVPLPANLSCKEGYATVDTNPAHPGQEGRQKESQLRRESSQEKRISKESHQLSHLYTRPAIEELSVLELRAIIEDTDSDVMGEAWEAFQRLLVLELEYGPHIYSRKMRRPKFFNIKLLEGYAQRLIQHRKHVGRRTRDGFLRLLSVLARLRRERARKGNIPFLKTQEWTALIHLAGTGLKNASLEAYNASLDVFNDMMRCHAEVVERGDHDLAKLVGPNIVTYTTLLNIAYATRHHSAIKHAIELLNASTKDHNRITFLCSMRHRYMQEGMSGARSILLEMENRSLNIEIDAVNAVINCASMAGQISVVRSIYQALRENLATMIAEENNPHKVLNDLSASDSTPNITTVGVAGIRFPRTLVPDEITYNLVVQAFAYHGYINSALEVFTDMLSTERLPPHSGFFQPSYVVFRAFFLGFSKHGTLTRKSYPPSQKLSTKETGWSWENLEIILSEFFKLSHNEVPHRLNERVVWWIMGSVRKTTKDKQKIRDIWQKLNSRFSISKSGRLMALHKKYGSKYGCTDDS